MRKITVSMIAKKAKEIQKKDEKWTDAIKRASKVLTKNK